MIIYKVGSGYSPQKILQMWMRKPQELLRCMPLTFLVYFGTYATANIVETMHTIHADEAPLKPRTPAEKFATAGFWITAAVGMSLCIYKDSRAVRAVNKASIPYLSYVLFAARDSATVLASASLPFMIHSRLDDQPVFSYATKSGRELWSMSHSVQLASVAGAQVISAPIHMLGLDVHNRQVKMAMRARIRTVWQHAFQVTSLRMMRVVPTFIIAGSVNKCCRTSMVDGAVKQP